MLRASAAVTMLAVACIMFACVGHADGPKVLSPTELSAIPTAPVLAGSAAEPALQWPICSEQTSKYGERIDPMVGEIAFHPGLDFRGEFGDNVYASASGTVLAAERRGPYGLMIEIDHGHGFGTRYSHLQMVFVGPNTNIASGQLIARIGSSGRSIGPHLHFEVWRDRQVQDPREFLSATMDCSRMATGSTSPSAYWPQTPKQSDMGFVWPVCAAVMRGFGYGPNSKNSDFHSGIDLGNQPGISVRAAANGRVVVAEGRDAYGLMMEIDHGLGFRTRYGNLKSFGAALGQKVSRGQVIGAVGATGYTKTPTLHFEVWFNDVVRDPMKYLEPDAACAGL